MNLYMQLQDDENRASNDSGTIHLVRDYEGKGPAILIQESILWGAQFRQLCVYARTLARMMMGPGEVPKSAWTDFHFLLDHAIEGLGKPEDHPLVLASLDRLEEKR
jgi:hypothetical protein